MFREAESLFPSDQSAKLFELAFDTLNDYLEFEAPDEAAQRFVANLKYAYSRTVIRRLREIPTHQITVFYPYVVLLFVRARSEFDGLIISRPELGQDFEACLERFRPQLEEILRRTRVT